MDKEAVVSQFAKFALSAETDFELTREAREAAIKVQYLMLQVAATDPLCAFPNGLLLHQCMI